MQHIVDTIDTEIIIVVMMTELTNIGTVKMRGIHIND